MINRGAPATSFSVRRTLHTAVLMLFSLSTNTPLPQMRSRISSRVTSCPRRSTRRDRSWNGIRWRCKAVPPRRSSQALRSSSKSSNRKISTVIFREPLDIQAHLIKDVPAWDRNNSGNVHTLSIVRLLVAREPECELASQPSQSRKGENSMKPENEAVPAMKLMKLRIATGLGLVLFMATMIGGPVRVSQAQDNQGGVTLASLAGKYAGRGSGFNTLCLNTFFASVDCALSPPHVVPFNF